MGMFIEESYRISYQSNLCSEWGSDVMYIGSSPCGGKVGCGIEFHEQQKECATRRVHPLRFLRLLHPREEEEMVVVAMEGLVETEAVHSHD